MKRKHRIRLNAPLSIGFAAVCLISFLISLLTGGASNRLLFTVYRSSLLDPLTYVRFVGHIFGHMDWNHLFSNMTMFLILAPMLEEKYGARRLMLVMLTVALVTGLIQWLFFPDTGILGASGVVFAMILLSSVTGTESGDIPVTLILVALLYIGQQVWDAVTVQGHISYMAHIVGGLIGGGAGLLLAPRRGSARRF